MKKLLLISILLFSVCFASNAQIESSKVRGWISIDNSITSISDKLPIEKTSVYIPYFSFGLEIKLKNEWAAVGELGIGMSKFSKLSRDINWFGELNEGNKLEIVDYSKFGKREIPFKVQLGIAHRFYLKSWHLTPQVSLGMSYLSSGSGYTYQLQEEGTDKKYEIEYRTLKEKRNDDTDRSAIFGYTQCKLRAGREISKVLSLEFGLAYTASLRSLKVFGTYTDLNTNEIMERRVIGKRPHELTFSIGIGFR